MEAIVLDNTPFEPDTQELIKHLRIDPDGEDAATVKRMAEDARTIGRPRGICGVAFIESKSDETVVIDSVTFASRVLRVNLEKVHRVFPYVATCGMELQEWSDGFDDMLERYWADTIKAAALNCARGAVMDYLTDRYQPGKMSFMSPGSLPDWPLSEQRRLFDLLGDPTGAIGVRLTDSFLMIPNKSVSGMRFAAETPFESCQLCPREVCSGRRAPYDKNLYERKYRQ